MFWMHPDALRDYFQTQESWEEYTRRYQAYCDAMDVADPNILQPGTINFKTKRRCKACGRYMLQTSAYLEACGFSWHLGEKCLMKLSELWLEPNPSFKWNKADWELET
jgi:hypothetical protein